jgi:hypothetical protein
MNPATTLKGFTTVPVALGRRFHSATERLSLHDNMITVLAPGAFSHLSSLVCLHVSNNPTDSDLIRYGLVEGLSHLLNRYGARFPDRNLHTLEDAIGLHTCSLEALPCVRPMAFFSGEHPSYRMTL